MRKPQHVDRAAGARISLRPPSAARVIRGVTLVARAGGTVRPAKVTRRARKSGRPDLATTAFGGPPNPGGDGTARADGRVRRAC